MGTRRVAPSSLILPPHDDEAREDAGPRVTPLAPPPRWLSRVQPPEHLTQLNAGAPDKRTAQISHKSLQNSAGDTRPRRSDSLTVVPRVSRHQRAQFFVGVTLCAVLGLLGFESGLAVCKAKSLAGLGGLHIR